MKKNESLFSKEYSFEDSQTESKKETKETNTEIEDKYGTNKPERIIVKGKVAHDDNHTS